MGKDRRGQAGDQSRDNRQAPDPRRVFGRGVGWASKDQGAPHAEPCRAPPRLSPSRPCEGRQRLEGSPRAWRGRTPSCRRVAQVFLASSSVRQTAEPMGS